LEHAAVREAREETSLDVQLIRQFHTYSDLDRDPRQHTISTVYIANASGNPRAKDDAQEIRVLTEEEIDFSLAFDHEQILNDYFAYKRKKQDTIFD